MRKTLSLLFAGMLAVAAANTAHAQGYPNRTIKIVVPATPGGAIDTIARLVADKMTVSLGQPVVVENRPGAANNLGTDVVAKSPPDGYTLLICASSHATNKHLYKTLPYDPVADFEPIVFTHIVPLLLAVGPQVPAKNVQELIAWIKANPDKASFASSGTGSSLHMAAELFKAMAGVKMLHVPYRGSTAAHPDLLGGRTAMIFDTITAIKPHVDTGAVRGLAVTHRKARRLDAEFADHRGSRFAGLRRQHLGRHSRARRGRRRRSSRSSTPRSTRRCRCRTCAPSSKPPASTSRAAAPQVFADYIKAEVEKWGKVTRDAGIVRGVRTGSRGRRDSDAIGEVLEFVMARLVRAIHVFLSA